MAEMLNFTFIVEEPSEALFLWVTMDTGVYKSGHFVTPRTSNRECTQTPPLGPKWVDFLKAVDTDVSEECCYPLGELNGVISHRTITWLFITVRTANIAMYEIRNPYHSKMSSNSWHLRASVKIMCRIFRPYISKSRQAMYVECEIEVRSCNHCCRGKAIMLHILNVCL
jgi:hypothetical protein